MDISEAISRQRDPLPLAPSVDLVLLVAMVVGMIISVSSRYSGSR